MTIEELKDSGAIYFEKITEGMQQYDNQIVRMNEYQAVDKFTELWEVIISGSEPTRYAFEPHLYAV